MTMYAGEAVRIRAVITDPDTGSALTPVPDLVVVDFWEPGRNPVKDEAVRPTPDQGPFGLTYRETEEDFVTFVDTTGWPAGKWTYRVTATGTSYKNWEYASLTLKP